MPRALSPSWREEGPQEGALSEGGALCKARRGCELRKGSKEEGETKGVRPEKRGRRRVAFLRRGSREAPRCPSPLAEFQRHRRGGRLGSGIDEERSKL